MDGKKSLLLRWILRSWRLPAGTTSIRLRVQCQWYTADLSFCWVNLEMQIYDPPLLVSTVLLYTVGRGGGITQAS